MNPLKTDNTLIMMVNLAGVAASYIMLAVSLYMSPDVPLATKGYWAIGILMLTLSLVNFVKYRFDYQVNQDRIRQIEDAKIEKILQDFVKENVNRFYRNLF